MFGLLINLILDRLLSMVCLESLDQNIPFELNVLNSALALKTNFFETSFRLLDDNATNKREDVHESEAK